MASRIPEWLRRPNRNVLYLIRLLALLALVATWFFAHR